MSSHCCHGYLTVKGALEGWVSCHKQEMVALTGLDLLDSWVCSEMNIFLDNKPHSLRRLKKKNKMTWREKQHIETTSEHVVLMMSRSLLSV